MARGRFARILRRGRGLSRRALGVFGATLLIGGLTACSFLPRAAKAPMPTQSWAASPSSKSKTLVVLLPGRNAKMSEFEQHGFLRELRAAGIKADVLSADAHLGYYYKRTIVDRLREDVLAPARERGYRRVVLVGISLGGLGALLCQRDLPGSADALILLSPYLGDRARLFEQIKSSGGPKAWAQSRSLRSGDVQEEIWTFLGQRSSELPPTWLFIGEKDALAPGERLFASLLPSARVTIEPGAHDWKTWENFWRQACASPEIFAEEKREDR